MMGGFQLFIFPKKEMTLFRSMNHYELDWYKRFLQFCEKI